MFATLSSRASRRPSRDFTSSSRRRAVTARRVQARALHAEGATAPVRRPLLHGIGAEKAPAKAPGLNEDRIVSPELGVQEAREDDFLVPRLEGDYGVREQKNLFAITRDGLRLIPELTPFPTERGCVTHTNLAGAAVVGGELWARPGAPYIWTINSGSMRYPLQEAHEYDEKAKLWTLPPKGSEERARLDQQWEAVAVYMLKLGAAVVRLVPLGQRFGKNVEFRLFVRPDLLGQDLRDFLRLAPARWKTALRQKLEGACREPGVRSLVLLHEKAVTVSLAGREGRRPMTVRAAQMAFRRKSLSPHSSASHNGLHPSSTRSKPWSPSPPSS